MKTQILLTSITQYNDIIKNKCIGAEPILTYDDIIKNKCIGSKPILTYNELREKVASYAMLEFKNLKQMTNTLVWSTVDKDCLFNTLYNKFLNGYKGFLPVKIFMDLYLIDKDDYQSSL